MDSIVSWATAICAALVGGGALSLISPSGNLKKSVSFAISLFFLCAIITPFITLDFSESLDFSVSQSDEVRSDTTIRLARAAAERGVKEILKSKDIIPQKIDTGIHINDDKSISITYIEITFDKDKSIYESEISGMIEEYFGIKVTIKYA
jgi:Stage III sporulation protein AF (Spore_III_AF).